MPKSWQQLMVPCCVLATAALVGYGILQMAQAYEANSLGSLRGYYFLPVFISAVVAILLVFFVTLRRYMQRLVELKRMEAELVSQANFQRTLLDAMNDVGMQLMVIENGRIIHVGNRKLAYEFGFTDADLDAHPALLDIIHPDDRMRVMDYHRRRLVGEAVPGSYELRLVTRDGQSREYEASVAVVPGTNPVRVISVGKDISERKQHEMLIQQQLEFDRRVSHMADNIPGFLYTFRLSPDGHGSFPYVSVGIRDVYGLEPEDVADSMDLLHAMAHPDDQQRIEAEIKAAAETLTPLHLECRIVHPVNGERWLEFNATPVLDLDGSILFHGIMLDITERKQMANAQKESHVFLRQVIDNIPDPVFVKDREHRWLHLNQAFCDFIGYNRNELIGKSDFDFFPKHEARVFWAKDEEVFSSGQEIVNEEDFSDRNGNKKTIVTKKACYTDVKGHEYLVGIIMDITERKLIEEMRFQHEQEFRSLVQNSPDVIIRYDSECRRMFVSDGYERVYGTPVNAVLGKKPTESWGMPDMPPAKYEQWLQEVMQTGQTMEIELDWHDADNCYHCQSLRAVPEYDTTGKAISVLTISRDISNLKIYGQLLENHQQELVKLFQELSIRAQHQRALLDNFPFHVWLKDNEGRILAANSLYAQGAKVSDTRELEHKTDFDLFPRELAELYVRDDDDVMLSGQPKIVVEPYQDESHQRRWRETWKSPLMIDGHVSGTVGFSRDVTEQMQREQELHALVDNTPDTIARYDCNCRRTYANNRLREETGGSLEQLLGKTPSEFPGWANAKQYEDYIRGVFASGQPSSFELGGRSVDGREACRHIWLAPERGPDGAVISVLAVGRDISEIDAYRQRIHHMAFYDTLTQLPNRALLSDRIRQTIADAAWHGHKFGLMLLDLDHFKEVNDTLGHGAGDMLLCEAASRLLEGVRTYDTVARLGGDEFAILLPEVREGDDVATVARKIVESFNQPFQVAGKELFVSTSVGIAIYPGDSADVDALFKYADSAMYHAKKLGRNNYQFYSRELTARASERMGLESALRNAIRNRELELYYQPQVDLASGVIIGAEALVRWNHPKHGVVTPDRFIPVAEESGLIVSIGEWVLSAACQAAVEWNTGREHPLRVAVNFSTRQFIRNDLVGSVQRILEWTGCRPEWIKLEITESLLLDDGQHVLDMLNTFNAMGLVISIDDFGTGYSALSYLNRFPVSQIKIDRSFVHDIPLDTEKSELVKAIVSISQALRMELVAEGVENIEQAEWLRRNGCPVAQGYLFGKPMPRHEFESLITDSAEEEADV